MRYFIHDPKSGKWFVDGKGFDTYDHNQAKVFESYGQAANLAELINGNIETL
jgi:hypothetical protein